MTERFIFNTPEFHNLPGHLDGTVSLAELHELLIEPGKVTENLRFILAELASDVAALEALSAGLDAETAKVPQIRDRRGYQQATTVLQKHYRDVAATTNKSNAILKTTIQALQYIQGNSVPLGGLSQRVVFQRQQQELNALAVRVATTAIPAIERFKAAMVIKDTQL
jgi:hypothetical protein